MATSRAFYMDLQPDWHLQQQEACWLNVYERSARFSGGEKPTVAVESHVHASFQLPMNEVATATHGKDNDAHLVEITKRERDWIEVRAAAAAGSSSDDLARVVFQAPREAVDPFSTGVVPEHQPQSRAPRKQLFSVDVANDEAYMAVGAADGKCVLWDLNDRTVARECAGHLMDVTRTAFFPSGKVLLTGSLDFTLRIWSVDTGRCAAVLKGHRGGVLDLAVVGRGKNVVSSASDGAVHLWCCGNQQIVAAWNNEERSAAQCLAWLEDSTGSFTSQDEHEPSPNEFETEGKLLFAGLENGQVLGIDVRARELAMDLRGSASILSCAATTQGGIPTLLTGGEDGVLMAWDIRQTSSPLHVLSRSESPINRIVVTNDDRGSVWTAQSDGACSNWSHVVRPSNASPFVSTELSGPQYDPVRDLTVSAATGRVFTACRDGLVREYIPHFWA